MMAAPVAGQRVRPVYLDHAATTPVDARVAAAMNRALISATDFGNPASDSHGYGENAAALVEDARRQVATAVGAEPAEVIFTSGATEADNLAILGVANYYRQDGRHLITSRTEHKAVIDCCAELQRRGWQVTYLDPDAGGRVHAEQVAAAMRADTVLVSLMLVNNEIGVIQDIAAISAACRAHGQAWLHVDAAQAVGKLRVDFRGSGADLMSLSAHKAYGPKGVGALLVSGRKHRADSPGGGASVQLAACQFGGGQERGLRAGTLATHQIIGMAAAFALATDSGAESEVARIAALNEHLWRGLCVLDGVWRNGDPLHVVPHLLNVSFADVEGESLLAAVRGSIAVSSGSACTSASSDPSYVLRALGRSERLSESSLRFGLGRFTTPDDIDIAVAAVSEAVRRLRRVSGG